MYGKESLTLWHGSPRKLIGEFLLPYKAADVSGRPENCHEGIYALEKREFAIVMSILKSYLEMVFGFGLLRKLALSSSVAGLTRCTKSFTFISMISYGFTLVLETH